MQYKYDVFVSYAHVNNEVLVPGQRGWVDNLVDVLRKVLAQKLPRDDQGRTGAKVWIDPRLPGDAPYDREIQEALEASATLLIVFSPAYLHSPWCQRERESFLRRLAERAESTAESTEGRIFVVEYDEAERPPELCMLPGYRFWTRDPDDKTARPLGFPVPRPDERDYYDRVLDVAHELATRVRELRRAPHSAPTPASGAAVFLAETTDDLDPQREEVRRYLGQAGFRVLPESWYPRDDPRLFTEAAKRDLAGARLFVQLLGPVAGRRPPELPQGYAALQCELAERAGVPVLQWRSRELDAKTVGDPHLKGLLHRATVQATGLEEFKRNVVERLRALDRPLPAPVRSGGAKFVFINSDKADRELATTIRKALEERRFGVAVMLDSGPPEELREFLEVNLLNCEKLIIVYGGSSQAWLMRQVIHYRKITGQRERDMEGWAVLLGPPPKEGELPFAFPDLQAIDCTGGFSPEKLEAFLRGFGVGGAS